MPLFEKFAKGVSYIFNPLIMPTLGIFIIFQSNTYLSYIPSEGKQLILSIVFTGTFLVPLCFVPLYLYLKVIKNMDMDDKNQRIVPYVITLVAFICTYFLIRRVPVPFINSFIIAICISLLLNVLFLIKWKISTHMIAAGSILALVLGLIFRLNAEILPYLVIVILMTGFLGFSRLYLEKHRPYEIYWGLGIGFFTTLIFLLFF